jgi:hypothetical protein
LHNFKKYGIFDYREKIDKPELRILIVRTKIMIKKFLYTGLTVVIVFFNTSCAQIQQISRGQITSIVQRTNGKIDAQNDIKEAQYKYYVIGQPMKYDTIWKTMLKKDYGIQLITLGCTPTSEEKKYAEEYNKVIVPFLKEKFGDNILSASEVKAREELEKDRK